MMKKNEYLYGDVEVPPIPQEIVDERIELLSGYLAELLDQSFHTRDTQRCTDIFKAITFWEKINSGGY